MIHNIYHLFSMNNLPKNVIELIQSIEIEMLHFKLLPGGRLIEDYLMLQYNAKRHTVRSALVELQRLGVVEKPPNSGAYIKRFKQKEIDDLYLVRDILCKEAIFLIQLPLKSEQFEELEFRLKQYSEALNNKDVVQINKTNMMFHHYIFSLCKNKFIVEMLDYHYWLSFPIRAYSASDEASQLIAHQEHKEMLDLLRKGNLEKLYQLNYLHMKNAKNWYANKFIEH